MFALRWSSINFVLNFLYFVVVSELTFALISPEESEIFKHVFFFSVQ